MEAQRKKVLQEARAKEQEKFRQMEERRKALEAADWERREALRKKNQVLPTSQLQYNVEYQIMVVICLPS